MQVYDFKTSLRWWWGGGVFPSVKSSKKSALYFSEINKNEAHIFTSARFIWNIDPLEKVTDGKVAAKLKSDERLARNFFSAEFNCSVHCKITIFSTDQCFHKWNLVLRTWGQKLFNGEKKGLLSKKRTKKGPVIELLRTFSRYFRNNAKRS